MGRCAIAAGGRRYLMLIGALAMLLGWSASPAAAVTVCPDVIVEMPTAAYVGQTLELSVSGDCPGIPSGATVQWQVSSDGGNSWSNDTTDAGNTTETLTVVNLQLAQNGNEYRVVYTNSSGTATLSVATITVLAIPVPASQTVTAGDAATFSLAGALTSDSSVQWQVSTDGGTTWSDDGTDSGATTTALTVADVSAAQSGNEYRAAITDEVGIVDTMPATLTVVGGGGLLVITTDPVNETVGNCGVAQPAIFTAAASGSPTPTVQWQVSTDGGTTFTDDTTDEGAQTDTLTIADPSASDSGNEYRAVFTASVGTATTPAATLTVDEAPAVVSQPTSVSAVSGGTASFSAVPSSCYSGGTVQWQVSTDGGATWANVSGATSGTLTLSDVTPSENGDEYQAVFSNAAGDSVTTTAATLTVGVAPAITAQPVSVTVTAGASATFTADASGSPVPAVQWQVSTDGGNTFSDVAGGSSFALTVADTSTSQNGNEYRAVFVNSIGTATTNAATLSVTPSGAPVVTQLTPSSGGAFSLVLISGTNLRHPTAVDFGAGHRAFFLPISASLVIALAPPQAAGTVGVTVTTAKGTSATSSADQFTYR